MSGNKVIVVKGISFSGPHHLKSIDLVQATLNSSCVTLKFTSEEYKIPTPLIYECDLTDPHTLFFKCKNFSWGTFQATQPNSFKYIQMLKENLSNLIMEPKGGYGNHRLPDGDVYGDEPWNLLRWKGGVWAFPPSFSVAELNEWTKCRPNILRYVWGCSEEGSPFYESLILEMGKLNDDTVDEKRNYDSKMLDKWFQFVNHKTVKQNNRSRKLVLYDMADSNATAIPKYFNYYFEICALPDKDKLLNLRGNCNDIWDFCNKKYPRSFYTSKAGEGSSYFSTLKGLVKNISWNTFKHIIKPLYKDLSKGKVVVILNNEDPSSKLLVALVMLLVDPNTRTIMGYSSLLFDCFSCSGKLNWSPILSFLNITLEIQSIHPVPFEFNENLIFHLLDVIYHHMDRLDGLEAFKENLQVSLFKNKNYISSKQWNFFDGELEDVCFIARHLLSHCVSHAEVLKEITTAPKYNDTKIQFNSYFLEDFSIFKNLSTLSLVNGNLSYLSSSINKLINLQELYLDDNLIQLVPDSISELVNLKILSLSRNMISRMPMLQLPLLKKLLIGSNHLSNLEFLVGCLQLEEISAFNNAIQHFPQGISCLTNLQTLNLHHNNFYHIPNNLLSHLTNLTDLDFSCTAIESIPISIGLLVQLSKLNLSDNHISNIQSNVFRPSITKLDLSRNNITTLSHNFAYLTQLTYLDIQCNKIEIIPQSMKNCSLLKNLNVSGNCLKGIPIWMMKMIKLEKLVLSKNEISCLASVIGNLTSLKELYLEDNKLEILPHSIDSLNNLEKLCLSGNPLNPKFLPQALIDVPSTKEVVDQIKECGKKYYADIQIPTKRMQIMVMGQEGSGKTALVRSLCYKWEVSEALPDNGVGIAITKVITNKKQNEKTISLELWDFSASSIEAYYATHRFFLHSWCVYVLLYNLSDPQAASKLGYWIHSIAIQVPKAKILIIATHTDIKSDKKWDLNILKQKFNSLHPGITFLKSFSVVSIVEDNNMMELRRYVRNISLEILQSNETQMDILNSKSFLQFEQVVKEYKSSLPIPIVSYDEIVSICYLCNITKISDTLMNYHKLGLLLYFGMSKDLRDFVILDPQWLYGEMAKLFIEGQTQEYGILDLSKLSLSAKPEYIKTKLLQLIAKFQIGFLFNGKENFSYLYETKQVGRSIRALFVPELIKKLDCPMDLNQFKQCLKSMHQINRSFKFNFIPIGLFPRLMTAVLQLLSPSVVTLWRRGIVFELKRANRVVSGLLENNFYDFLVAKESNNSTNLFEFIGEKMENLITLELISGDLDLLCETFYWILELIITVSSDWNQKFTMYWHPSDTSPVSIEEMKKLNLNQANKDLPGKIDWGTAIPEVVLPTYQGKRYLPDDIKTTEEIARGAYGIVFLGIVEYKQVAIKEIFLNDETEQEILIRLKLINEIVLHSRLKHPNIVNLEGICWESRRIVFELCTLGNLHQQIVDLNFHFSWKYRVRILTDIMKGVHYLHSLPIPVIHRDLKSLNIMIISTHPTDPINAKITDFGTATYYTHPLTTRVVDNPSWLAPEIIEKKEYGLASDIYAFGMVAWETFCRELPFLLKWGEVEEKVLAGERPPLPSESPALFNELLNECWHQVPSSRPSPTDIIKKLGEIDQLDNIEEDNIAFQRRKKRNSLPVFLAGSRIPRQDSQNKSKIQRKGARVL